MPIKDEMASDNDDFSLNPMPLYKTTSEANATEQKLKPILDALPNEKDQRRYTSKSSSDHPENVTQQNPGLNSVSTNERKQQQGIENQFSESPNVNHTNSTSSRLTTSTVSSFSSYQYFRQNRS